MTKTGRTAPATTKRSRGRKGGNRGGEDTREAKVPKRSRQSAGKDPMRNKGES